MLREVTSIDDIQQLYDRNLFLDAFQQSAEYWAPSTRVRELSTQQLVLGGRLAVRLGGMRLSRHLFREAYARDPDDPRVRFYSHHARRRRRWLFEDLREFERDSNYCAADPEMQACWLASFAIMWAHLRNFSRAHECIARAHVLSPSHGWISSCESNVLGVEDRWSEALQSAEIAWQLDPGSPHAAASLSTSLLKLGRLEEAAQRLTDTSATSQSYEVVRLACWYQGTLAEISKGNDRSRAVQSAVHFAEQLPQMAPLADRDCLRDLYRARLSVAELVDDDAAIERWAEQARIPFYRKVLANRRRNPPSNRIRLPFAGAIQKHEACLPTSLASAVATVGGHLDPDTMAAEITFGGTTEWAAAEWLEKRGFAVRFFAVTRDTAVSLIRNGIGFVLTLEGDDNAHAVAAVGLDEAAETLIIHDPMGYRTVEYLLEAFTLDAEPLGIKGMVTVSPERASFVDGLLPETDVAIVTAAHLHQKAVMLQGPTAARKIVADLAKKLPNHPGTRLLTMIQAAEDGRTNEAMTGFQKLLSEFPRSVVVRSRFISVCRAKGNSALMRETLAGAVEHGLLPGVQSQQDWQLPPARYVAEYADHLSQSRETRQNARSLLHDLLGRKPQSGEGWHVLGDLLWIEHDTDGALMCYRIGSALAAGYEHYAYAYCDALSRSHRQAEGFEWLEDRVKKFGASPRAVGTWVTWIRSLENWGHPERALCAFKQALSVHRNSAELLAFGVPFLARMGGWQEADRHLSLLESTGNRPLLREASVEYYRLRGDLQRAIEQAQLWVEEVPRNLSARHSMVNLIARRDGGHSALELADKWKAQNPGHDGFDDLYYRRLEPSGEPRWKRYSVLLRRVKRNREDAWAWRELTFCAMDAYGKANARGQAKLRSRVEKWLVECDRTGEGDAATIRAHARWAEICNDRTNALTKWLEAIEREPATSYSYQRAWECSASSSPEERKVVWARMEPMLLGSSGHLALADEIVPMLARRFGVTFAEQTVSQWQGLRPDDPEISDAYATLLLEHGQGRTDAERALGMLQTAVDHFPYHIGLRSRLVGAWQRLGKLAEAEEGLREFIRRHPDNSSARIQLAKVHEQRGQLDTARTLLEQAALSEPQSRQVSEEFLRILIRQGQFEAAKTMIANLVQRSPRDVGWRDRSIRFLLDCGDQQAAVEVAREGVKVYPRGAYLWFLLGTTLNRLRRFAQPGEIESCFRQSVSFNPTLFDAADQLAILLTEQRRYADAEEVLSKIKSKLNDPSPALGRLAWTHRRQGRTAEAREEMTTVIREFPWYLWGWSQVMDWLVEDKAWDEAKALLSKIPNELRTNPQFRMQRLTVLQKAGLPAKELDEEWNGLLRDFPQEGPAHLQRFDLLVAANRHTEAHAVLNQFRPSNPNNPYYLARLISVRAKENKLDEVLRLTERIFFAENEDSTWPVDTAWTALKSANYQDRGYGESKRLLEKERRPTYRAFYQLCSYALEHGGTKKVVPQSYWATWFPDRGVKGLLGLLAMVDRSPWTDAAYRATALERLNSVGHYRTVLRYWKAHRGETESEVATWAEVGRALASLGQKSEAQKLLSTWRKRRGASMWMVANYIGTLSRLSQTGLREVADSSEDALRNLPHDHTARYLAHAAAEAHALLGDMAGVKSAWQRYRNYYDCKAAENEWFKDGSRHLLTDIPSLAEFAESGQDGPYRRKVWSLRWKHISRTLGRPSPFFKSMSVPWWCWWIVVWMLVTLANLLQNH